MNIPRTESEILQHVHRRYEDTALVIFRQYQKRPQHSVNYLTFGESRKTYSYSNYGNTAVVMRKKGQNITKVDEKPIQSTMCTIM